MTFYLFFINVAPSLTSENIDILLKSSLSLVSNPGSCSVCLFALVYVVHVTYFLQMTNAHWIFAYTLYLSTINLNEDSIWTHIQCILTGFHVI